MVVDGASTSQENKTPETEAKKPEPKKKGSGMKLQSGKSSEINWDAIEAEVQKEDNGGGWGKDVKCMNSINHKCFLKLKHLSTALKHLDHFLGTNLLAQNHFNITEINSSNGNITLNDGIFGSTYSLLSK